MLLNFKASFARNDIIISTISGMVAVEVEGVCFTPLLDSAKKYVSTVNTWVGGVHFGRGVMMLSIAVDDHGAKLYTISHTWYC